jgi:hypothetical protein
MCFLSSPKNAKRESLKYDFNCVSCIGNYIPMLAQRGGGGVAPTFSQPGTVWARMVSTMLWQLYPQERLGTPCTKGWVCFCADLDDKEDLVRTKYDPQSFQPVDNRYTGCRLRFMYHMKYIRYCKVFPSFKF